MKKQRQFSLQDFAQVPKLNPSSQIEDSQYLDQYNQYFSHLAAKYQEINVSSVINLDKYGIRYTPESPYHPFKVSIQTNSKNSEIVILSVIWGHFFQQISIINFLHENNRANRPNQIDYSPTIILYEKLFQGKSVMFKSQLLTPNYRSSIILSVVKEVFIAKIGSALGFGPYCHMQTFFDLFIYDNCIEFGMEKCLGFQDEVFDKESQEELKQSLLLMHSFKIIHFDIKPGNIMFSRHYNKYVLIDFNLSDVSDLQLGKKVEMTFRGTVKFCCPEMVHNFLAGKDQVKKVDPFYNDIFCLQESIKMITTEIRRVVSPIRLEYLSDILQENQQQNAILLVKKAMYLEDWTKVYQFFSQPIYSQQFFKILIEFLYELQLTEQLQVFYNTFIPAGLKETFLTRQFQYLLRKKWMVNSENNSTMLDKRLEYETRMEFVLAQRVAYVREFTKEEVEEYLSKQQKFKTSKVLYFSLFLEYISLSSNKFGVDRNDRKIASKKCISFIISKLERNQKQISAQILLHEQQDNESLIKVIMMILQWIFAGKQPASKQDNFMIPNLLLQILSFIIILDIGTLEENLIIFEKIHECLEKDEDRLSFLLSLKQLNEWNKNRIGKKGENSRYVTVQQINEFTIIKLREFNVNCPFQLKKIIKFALRQQINLVQPPTLKYQGTNLTLKKLSQRQQFDLYLQLCTHDNTSIQKICRQIQKISDSHFSFQHFYFNLYERYKYIGGLEFCSYIKKIYSQNIKDPSLQKRFSIYYKNVVVLGTNKQFLTAEFQKIQELLNEIEGEDIGLSISVIERVSNIVEVLAHNQQLLTQHEYHYFFNVKEKIYSRLKLLIQRYYAYKAERKGMKVHECFNVKQELDLYVYNMERFQTVQKCKTFFEGLRGLKEYKTCIHCAFVIECFSIMCQQTWILVNYPQNSLEILLNLQAQLNSIKIEMFSKQVQYKDYLQFKDVMSHMMLNYATFCTYEKEYQLKYKGLRNLFYSIKQQVTSNTSILWIYLSNKDINKVLLQFTMQILLDQQFEELGNYLVLLAQHLDKHLAQSSFNVLLICFMKLLISNDHIQQMGIQKTLRKQISLHPEVKNQLTIYFYCLAMIIQDQIIQQRLYFRIAPTLANLPFDLQIFYSSAIYLHFAKLQRTREDISHRRRLFINNKLVKLLLLKHESKIGKGTKHPNYKNAYMKLLVKKLRKIEGPITTMMDSEWKYEYSMKFTH